MSKRNKSSASKKKKAGSLAYQIKKLELRRKGKDKPMLAKTEQQYKKHALKFAEYCKSTYRCKTLEECKSHIQDYANYLTASGKTASTTHTYLASICRVFDIPLSDIKKPIRVVAHNTRSRGRKAVDERKDAGRKVSPRLYDFASIVGIRRNEYLHLASDDLVVDDFGNWCVRVKKGKGGKQQLQRILPEELKAVKAIFDHPADGNHLFSKVEMENKIDLHHLRALRAQKCINIIWNVSVVRQVTASDLYRKLSTLGNRMTSNASIMAIVLSGGKIVKLTATTSCAVTI